MIVEEIKSIIEDMLKRENEKKTYTDCEEYWKQGAIGALEELLDKLNSMKAGDQ